ncbi:putative U-box domain-containing protein 55 [Bienertia sinuspersici]
MTGTRRNDSTLLQTSGVILCTTEDGYTYEGDVIRGWSDSSHTTSPVTNLKFLTYDLIPNYALFYEIQEWQQRS